MLGSSGWGARLHPGQLIQQSRLHLRALLLGTAQHHQFDLCSREHLLVSGQKIRPGYAAHFLQVAFLPDSGGLSPKKARDA